MSKHIFYPFRRKYSFLCIVAVALSYECKPTLAIRGRFRATDSSLARGITSDFYGPMNVHRGTVISAIVTMNLFCCIVYGRATLLYKSHIA